MRYPRRQTYPVDADYHASCRLAAAASTDMLAAHHLARSICMPTGARRPVVENRRGANNQVAAEYVTHQPGDGYTLFIGPETTFIVNPALYPGPALFAERFHADRRPGADLSTG